MSPRARRIAGQFSASFFLLPGLFALGSAVFGSGLTGRVALFQFGAVEHGLALIAFLVPWQRLPDRAALTALFLGASLLVVLDDLQTNAGNVAQPYLFGLWFLGGYAWIGLHLPRWTSIWSTPVIVPILLYPFFVGDNHPAAAAASAAIIVPVGVVLAESIAWSRQHAAHARRRFRSLVRYASDGIAVIDAAGTVTFATEALERIAGSAPSALIGRSAMEMVHPQDRPAIEDVLIALRDEPHASTHLEFRVNVPAEPDRWVDGIITNLLTDPVVRGFVLNARDATERKQTERILARQAMHDPLTQLPNRALLLERLTQALARARRTGALIAVLFLDVDRFKVINDSLGHAAGDQLLCGVAVRLREATRESDTVGRFGGDEFIVLCEDIVDETEAALVTQRIESVLAEPFVIAGSDLFVTVSVGVALASGDEDPETLLQHADTAMYRAKELGRTRVEIFNDSLSSLAVRKQRTESALHRALERDELLLHYQPIIDLERSSPIGVEALLRWRHPEQGLIPPLEFIPLAEETGLIVPIGNWVLQQGCEDLTAWNAARPNDDRLTLSVNVSGRQLSHPDFIIQLTQILSKNDVNPQNIVLEITESTLVDDSDDLRRLLDEISALGVRLALDDFGTGYSSLAHLKNLPVDLVKIDGAFTRGLGSDTGDAALVSAIINMANALGISAVAEGVETEQQLQMLRELGCRYAQGYHFAKPAAASAIDTLLDRWSPSLPRAS